MILYDYYYTNFIIELKRRNKKKKGFYLTLKPLSTWPTMSALSSLVDELRRRNVLKLATAYAVASFIVLQLCDILFPAIGFSDSDNTRISVVLPAPLGPRRPNIPVGISSETPCSAATGPG